MHFAFSDEQAMIAETVAAFFAEHATSERTRAAMATVQGIDHDLWRAFAQDLGLAGVAIAEADGGVGLGMVELAIVAEAAGRHVAALPFIASMATAASAIAMGGSSEQRATWLPKLARGETIGAMAIASDAHGGRAAILSDGKLDSRIELVPHGAAADVFVVAIQGMLVLVPRGAEGVTVTPLVTMDQTRPLARLDLVGVAAHNTLAPGCLDGALDCSRLAIAADALGGAQACLDRTVDYVRTRVQFGRPIGSFQAVKHQLADMMVDIEQARSAVYWAACALDEGVADARLAVHAAKAFATDTYAMCAGRMIQLHGGIGFTWEHDAHLFFKRARADQTLLGTPAWHREQIARLIGLGKAA